MRKFLRWLAYGLGAIALLFLLFALWAWFASSRVIGRVHEAVPETLARSSAAQLADAGRQARINGASAATATGWKAG